MDIQRIRAETPGVEKVTHLNNCGAGLMPEPVLDAILKHLRLGLIEIERFRMIFKGILLQFNKLVLKVAYGLVIND